MLDERILQTPLKRELLLPNLNLTQEIVKEWDQDSKKINTESMIFYGLISTSLDKIVDNKNLYINDIGLGVNAGIISIGVTWGYNSKELLSSAGASYLVNDSTELSKLMKTIFL